MRSETEDLQDLTDTALQQVQSMYSQTEQLFAEFSTKGKLFLQNSSTVRFSSGTQAQKLQYSRIVALGLFGPVQHPVVAMLQTEISMTIRQTDIISTNKQLNNAVTQSSHKCAERLQLNLC